MKTANVKPNPVGKMVTAQVRDLLDKVDTATAKARSRVFLDFDWNEGYEFGDGADPIGPAPTAECLAISIAFKMDGRLDATRPLVPQIVAWLGKCASDIQRATEGVNQVKEKRDIRALRVLVAQTEEIQ
jgi:hypothetical protein